MAQLDIIAEAAQSYGGKAELAALLVKATAAVQPTAPVWLALRLPEVAA